MKALILVGGFGTRLRPLTLSKPKPLVEFCNKPMLQIQIEALKAAGVDEVVLAIGYQPELMSSKMAGWEEELGVKITYSQEHEPMGTAGPLGLARDVLLSDPEPFFVLNSDVVCCFPLKQLLEFHKKHGKEGTIMATRVEEPSKYGVVVSEPDGKILRFVEKPQVFVGNFINAGLYIFNKSILNRIPNPVVPTSIEKVVFPAMASDGQLYVMELEGHWADVGQPGDYLVGMALHLKWLKSQEDPQLAKGAGFIGSVLVHPTAKIGKDCLIGPDVVIGPNCVVGDGARISRSALLGGAHAQPHCFINLSIIGWSSTVGKWARLDNETILGEDIVIKDELFINGAKILPHKGINESIPEPKVVM